MTAKNDITGDTLKSKGQSKAYDDGWDRIFGKNDDADLGLEGDTREAVHPAETRYPFLKDKDFKFKQQNMTELNADGNEDRGRYGEDLTSSND